MSLSAARHNMITQQIRPWDVSEGRVLELMLDTPREAFVPPAYRALAYVDMELPLGHGRTMLPPRVEARLLQALSVQGDESVLEIGTGGGYLTALLARQAQHVHSLEPVPELSQAAAQRLHSNGFDNVTLESGTIIWPQAKSYDVIVLTGSLPELPQALFDALRVGGRLFAVVGEAPVMEAQLITRSGEREWTQADLFETELRPLSGLPQRSRFSL